MNEPQRRPLVLTGNVYDRQDDVEITFEAGDVAVYHQMDADGRAAVREAHPNYGYSGYFRASVFDGKNWRRFKIWEVVSKTDRQYQGPLPDRRLVPCYGECSAAGAHLSTVVPSPNCPCAFRPQQYAAPVGVTPHV